MVCAHFNDAALGAISAYTKIHKEECTQCFDSQDGPEGIDVCLKCFNGGCVGPQQQHGRNHFKVKGHAVAVNIRRVTSDKAKRPEDGSPPPQKISKIVIAAEDEAQNYEYISKVRCYECDVLEDPKDYPTEIVNVVEKVLNSMSSAKQSKIEAWEEKIYACEHTLCVEQEASKQLEQQGAHCASCDLKENLWLCLACGNLGCGRKQYDGSGGNNHGVEHFKETGHSVSCKLGTITPEGTADIYCYTCEDAKLDNDLAKHLANWGINVAQQSKTEKSMDELQLEQNLNFDFSMTTEDGKELEPKFGAGYTGLKNLGNSCYMASVLQSVFAIPEFQKRYDQELQDHAVSCSEDPTKCLLCQLHKIADGLLSGKYSQAKEPKKETESPSQDGISPGMFKDLIGKDHVEFSTMRQQDAYEFLMYFCKAISQKEHTNKSRDPSRIFDFSLEQRIQCNKCKKVRYQTDRASSISVNIPARKVATESNDEKLAIFEPVDFYECLDLFVEDELVEGYRCSNCSETTTASKSQKFKTAPDVLVLQARRFEFVNYVPQKLNIPIQFPDSIKLDKYFGAGPQPDEELLPEEQKAEASEPEVDLASLEQLIAMGFPEDRCKRAIQATGNSGADVAMNWIFEHMDDDPTADVPTTADQPTSENISMLCGMGFSESKAIKALKETNNDMERAVEWVFSHPDDSEEEDTKDETPIGDANPPFNYTVQSFVSHKGTSVHCGHYVAHIYKNGQWILYNDNRVAVSPNPPIGDAYLYFLQRENPGA